MRRITIYCSVLWLLWPTSSTARAGPQDQQLPNVGPSTETYVEGWKAYIHGDYSRALVPASRGLELDRHSGWEKGVAEALNLIGTVHYKRGDYSEALQFYLQAAESAENADYSFGLARDWSSLGSTYYRIGEYGLAQQYYEKSLQLRKQLGDREEIARALNDLANVLQQLGSYSDALSLRMQALRLWQQTRNQIGAADALDDIGWTLEEMGQDLKALRYIRRSLFLNRKTHLQVAVFDNLEGLGLIYSKMGRYREAFANLNAAYAGFVNLGQQDEIARTLNDLGDAWYGQGAYSSAVDRYQDALKIEMAIGNRPVEGITLGSLMECWKSLQRSQLAIFYGKQAVNLYQRFRGGIRALDPALQKSFLRSKTKIYRELADVLITDGRLPEAQQVLDLLKDQEYFDFVRGDEHAAGAKSKPITLNPEEQSSHEAYQKIAGQITAIGIEWSDLHDKRTRTPEEEARMAELKEKLTVANQEMGRFFKTLYVEFGKNAQANQSAENVREQAGGMQSIVRELGPGTVALYTLVGESRYSVIVITASTMQAREFSITDTDLRRKVAAFLEAMKNPASDPLPASQELYKILVAPIAEDLKAARAQTLMWSLNDVLRYVPMAALHDGKQYLVESYRNVVITPASIGRLKDAVDVRHSSIAGMGVSKDYDGLGPLPAVPEELKHIIGDDKSRGAGGVLPGTLMLDDDFTEAHLASALDKHYAVVHIASHFVLQAGNETNSYLLLGGKDVGGKGYHLTLAELRDDPALTFDGTELLTLSACQTGTSGTALNGREVDGLGITAQQKGAKAVLASLWSVADESTALLMADFYRQWLGTPGITKVGALRQAQLNMLHGVASANQTRAAPASNTKTGADKKPLPSYTHPFFWGGFILIGNWK